MKEKPRHPAEITGREFLYIHGYKGAMNGGYKTEFDRVKAILPELAGFTALPQFIKGVEADSAIANKIAKDLIRLWQSDYELRPATGIILLLTLWKRLDEGCGRGKGFVTVCEDIFFILAGIQPYKPFSADEYPDVIAALIGKIKER